MVRSENVYNHRWPKRRISYIYGSLSANWTYIQVMLALVKPKDGLKGPATFGLPEMVEFVSAHHLSLKAKHMSESFH